MCLHVSSSRATVDAAARSGTVCAQSQLCTARVSGEGLAASNVLKLVPQPSPCSDAAYDFGAYFSNPVTESARAHSYSLSSEVRRTCQFCLLTPWLLTVPSFYIVSKSVFYSLSVLF